jgi:hypothetical protein
VTTSRDIDTWFCRKSWRDPMKGVRALSERSQRVECGKRTGHFLQCNQPGVELRQHPVV